MTWKVSCKQCNSEWHFDEWDEAVDQLKYHGKHEPYHFTELVKAD